jgi:hypothetical protein
MANAEVVKIGEKEFTARTLSVKDVIDVFDSSEKRKLDVIDHLFEDGLDSQFFYKALQISIDDVSNLTPEEVKTLMEAVARVNPTYAGMEKRLKNRLAELRKTLSAPAAV